MITIIRKWINSVSRTYRYIRLTIIRLKGTHEEVAEGMALGIFIGMTPTMGIQVYLAFVASMFLKKIK